MRNTAIGVAMLNDEREHVIAGTFDHLADEMMLKWLSSTVAYLEPSVSL